MHAKRLRIIVGIILTDLTLQYFCTCPKQNMDFQCNISWSFFVLSELRSKVIVRLVDIGGTHDHHLFKS
jgi:hypothetical protein